VTNPDVNAVIDALVQMKDDTDGAANLARSAAAAGMRYFSPNIAEQTFMTAIANAGHPEKTILPTGHGPTFDELLK
jgi:hypothetical protein